MEDRTTEFKLKESPEEGGDREDGYKKFLEDLARQGLYEDGDKIAREGLQLLQAIPGRQSVLSQIISIAAASDVFKDKSEALLLDLLARASFVDRRERLYFLDWVDWCVEFGVPLDNCLRYLASSRSEGGLAVEQAIRAMTQYTHRQLNYGSNKLPRKDKRNPGISDY